MTQAAWGASRTRRSYFYSQHQRIASRRGVKRATIAVGHSLLVTVHCLLSDPKPYVDLGKDYFEKAVTPEKQADQMVRKLKRLGYIVEIKRVAA